MTCVFKIVRLWIFRARVEMSVFRYWVFGGSSLRFSGGVGLVRGLYFECDSLGLEYGIFVAGVCSKFIVRAVGADSLG